MRTALLPCALLLVACETNEYYSDDDGGGATVTVSSVVTVTSGGEGTGGDDASTSGGGDGGTGPATTTSTTSQGGGGGQGGQGGEEPFLEGAPEPTVDVAELAIDPFGVDGNRYWFAVDPSEVERMNKGQFGGGGDIYTPGGGAGPTHANHLFATTAGDDPQTADYGKVEVRVIGESTWRPWASDSIPNLRVDTEEFQEDHELAGYKDFRFNNGLVGTIFREEIALEIYNRLGYPAPYASFAWVGSNVWGADVAIPYTMVEVYKKGFCSRRRDQFPDGCENMWEFVGDFGYTDFSNPENCQFSSCETARISELDALVVSTPPAAGFKAALAEYLDWDSVHRAQCLSWMLWTGDDAFHNTNNVVILERGDGKFMYLPYSIDISGGQEWYQFTPLYGQNSIARGCQADAACWADTIATCEALIEDFAAIDPAGIVDEAYDRLSENGMLRDGDEDRYELIRGWYAQRAVDLLPELDFFREQPCDWPNVKCNGECTSIFECVPECGDGLVACRESCVLEGECFDCFDPHTWCGDGSCMLPGACP